MKQPSELVNKATRIGRPEGEENKELCTGGLPMRTDLRAGLAWDDLDDQAQQLWSNLTNALSNLTGGADTSS